MTKQNKKRKKQLQPPHGGRRPDNEVLWENPRVAYITNGDQWIQARSDNQARYIETIRTNDMTVGIGPAGTGKTYIPVAMALQALKAGEVSKIVITRPIVEAGEKLGFLPGALEEKINPYLRPIYDAIESMDGFDSVDRLINDRTLEIAPIAYMRGRAQPLDAVVYTNTGSRCMGDVKVGDSILGRDGSSHVVSGVYPQGEKDIYKVTLSDGSFTLCSLDHLWFTKTRSDYRHNKLGKVRTTEDIMKTLKVHQSNNHEIPVTSPVNFVHKDVSVDPYVLGLLLGDGMFLKKATVGFSTNDKELVESIATLIPEIYPKKIPASKYDYRLIKHDARLGKRNPLHKHITDLGLMGKCSYDKFVPEEYKINSIDIRLAILQGLLDSDGTCGLHRTKNARVQFSSTSEQLADDVVFLVQSLGGVAHKNRRTFSLKDNHMHNGRIIRHTTPSYVVDIGMEINPFRLKRKANKFVNSKKCRVKRFISSIELAGKRECQCISVTSPDNLYLTDNFIVTHNTMENAFIIVDEAQNTTVDQLEMLVTRMGMGSKLVITGDITQVDLPKRKNSGLLTFKEIVGEIDKIKFHAFTEEDVMRHPIVKEIVKAYELWKNRDEQR